jgi:hypothetical protein
MIGTQAAICTNNTVNLYDLTSKNGLPSQSTSQYLSSGSCTQVSSSNSSVMIFVRPLVQTNALTLSRTSPVTIVAALGAGSSTLTTPHTAVGTYSLTLSNSAALYGSMSFMTLLSIVLVLAQLF